MTAKEAVIHRKLMLVLARTPVEDLSSDILCGLAAMFLRLGAEQIRRERA